MLGTSFQNQICSKTIVLFKSNYLTYFIIKIPFKSLIPFIFNSQHIPPHLCWPSPADQSGQSAARNAVVILGHFIAKSQFIKMNNFIILISLNYFNLPWPCVQ